MSLHEYKMSRVVAELDYPFYSLIMAAMRKADSVNEDLLRRAFPATFMELRQRYNALGGLLEGEHGS